MDDLDVLGRDPELVGDDLGEGRLVPLALGLDADRELRLAAGVDPQRRAVVHPEAEDVHLAARPGADRLGEEGEPDPHQLAPLALGRLLAAQLLVAGDLQRAPQRRLVVARVVDPAGLRLVGELVGRDQVVGAQLGGVGAELLGEAVDEPLDQVDGLGDRGTSRRRRRPRAPCWCRRR